MEYIKPRKEKYKDYNDSYKQVFGMQNFMFPGTEDYERALKLARQGKTIDGYENGYGYIVRPISELVIDAENYQGIYYTIDKPQMVDQDLQNKLVVWFSPFPDRYDSPAEFRIFSKAEKRWPTLKSRLAHNTFILRLADSNLISGSFFQNTENFPDYEEKIQELIKKIANDYEIPQQNVILYGDSRGGTGAFIHALLGSYPAVLLDPIISRVILVQEDGGDPTLCGDLIPMNFVERINQLLEKVTVDQADRIKVISSDGVLGTWPYLKQLDVMKFLLLKLDYQIFVNYNHDRISGVFATGNFPLALQLMNEFLYEKDLQRDTVQIENWSQKWQLGLPSTCRDYIYHFLDDGLEVERTDYDSDESLNFVFETPLIKDHNYEVTITLEAGENKLNLAVLKSIDKGGEQLIRDPQVEESKGKQIYHYSFFALDSWEYFAIDSRYPKGWKVKVLDIKLSEK